MKKIATIFSWLCGVATAVYYVIQIALIMKTGANTASDFLWILYVVLLVVDFVVLIWRQKSVADGHKVACGILTIIFCGAVGGILTLCIPAEELGAADGFKKYLTE